jgi:hypothetical protein
MGRNGDLIGIQDSAALPSAIIRTRSEKSFHSTAAAAAASEDQFLRELSNNEIPFTIDFHVSIS